MTLDPPPAGAYAARRGNPDHCPASLAAETISCGGSPCGPGLICGKRSGRGAEQETNSGNTEAGTPSAPGSEVETISLSRRAGMGGPGGRFRAPKSGAWNLRGRKSAASRIVQPRRGVALSLCRRWNSFAFSRLEYIVGSSFRGEPMSSQSAPAPSPDPDRPLTPAQLAELDALLAAARYADNLSCLDADRVSRWDVML